MNIRKLEFKLLVVIIISLLLIFSKIKSVHAIFYWNEEFNQNYTNNWIVFDEDNYLGFIDSYLHFNSSNPIRFPYIYTPQRVIPENYEEYELVIRLRYNPKNYTYGAGIVLDDFLYTGRINFQPPRTSGIFKIWPQIGNKFGFKSNIPSVTDSSCNNGCFFYFAENETAFLWHELKIIRRNSTYHIEVNGVKYFESVPTERKITYIWVGNPEILKTQNQWPDFDVDYIHITAKNAFPTNKSPIILIPGMFASWNWGALFFGQNVPQSEWGPVSLAPLYYGPIENTIESAGYITDSNNPNRNFFTFYYDWRKPTDELADEFNQYVQDNIQPDSGLKIVGHSQGGLVGRAYVQKYKDAAIDKLITVGTPHSGLLDAYYAWEGAEAPPGTGILMRILFGAYLTTNRLRGFTSTDVVQNTVPSLKDLLPLFDYLKNYHSGNIIPVDSMSQQNLWLKGLQPSFTNFFSIFDALVGNSFKTREWIQVKKPSIMNRILNKWQDGKPIKAEWSPAGDERVLVKSGKVEKDPYHEINADHGGVIYSEDGVRKIAELLEIQPKKFFFGQGISLPAIFFAILSPANIHVTGPEGFNQTSNDYIILTSAKPGEYNVKVTGQKSGDYRLISGFITEDRDQWNEFADTTNQGKTDNFSFSFNPQAQTIGTLIDQTGEQYLRSARQKLSLLKENYNHRTLKKTLRTIDKALKHIKRNRLYHASASIKEIISETFIYRKSIHDPGAEVYNQTDSALADLENSFVIVKDRVKGKKRRRGLLNKAQLIMTRKLFNATKKKLEMMEKFVKATKKQALSLLKAEELLQQTEQAVETNNQNLAEILLFKINLYLAESNK